MLLTPSEAARVLGVSATAVRLWERLGKLPAQRTQGGYRLFELADVEALARQRAARTE